MDDSPASSGGGGNAEVGQGGGGGGGGGAGPARLTAAFGRALISLRIPACAGLFNTSGAGVDPTVALTDIYNSTRFGSFRHAAIPARVIGGIRYIPNATTDRVSTYRPGPPRVFAGFAAQITINTDPSSGYNRGTVLENAVTLLHELGHAYNLPGMTLGGSRVGPDDFLSAAGVAGSTANTALVAGVCR
jgi:hypothetical protein